MDHIGRIAEAYVNESKVDYICLAQIPARLRRDMGLGDAGEVRENTLLVVRRLLESGLRPGDYFKTGFRFWNEDDPDAIIARIDREWDPACGDPTLADPICWFAAL